MEADDVYRDCGRSDLPPPVAYLRHAMGRSQVTTLLVPTWGVIGHPVAHSRWTRCAADGTR